VLIDGYSRYKSTSKTNKGDMYQGLKKLCTDIIEKINYDERNAALWGIDFEDYKEEILEALHKKLLLNPIAGEGGFDLVEGFFNTPFQDKLVHKIYLGGKTVPMVAIVGNLTGSIHFFALKQLLPRLVF